MVKRSDQIADVQGIIIMPMRLVGLTCLVSILTVLATCTAPAAQPNNAGADRSDIKQVHQMQDPETLIKSIERGDSATVKQLLSAGANPNEKGSSSFTPLMMAVLKQNKEIIGMLLRAGADTNAGDKVGTTALMMAVHSRDTEIVRLLLDKGADVAVKEPYYGRTALHVAAQVADADMMRMLLATSGNPDIRDSDDSTPLMIAASINIEVVKVLIEKGADVNARNKHGGTPLMMAIGSLQTMRLLLEHGADVNAKDKDNWTALERALLRGCPDEIRLLEKAGAKD
jgi:ankyrin repeat protein